ncbi:RWD domain-containing protein 3 [Bulinus truncatus]|nr:RWD domain-containing protein 3 [Bulinus truncatus]
MIIMSKKLGATKNANGQHIIVSFIGLRSTLNISIEDSKNTSIHFTLSQFYPVNALPCITLTCSLLPDSVLQTLVHSIHARATALQGQPMLMDLICYSQELIAHELQQIPILASHQSELERSDQSLDESSHNHCGHTLESPAKRDNPIGVIHSDVTALLQLDHMRSKQNYVKLIKKWTSELSLTGRLLFCKKLILILLQGNIFDVKEYIIRNRTHNVDIDSKGRHCKEKMLTVLCEVPAEPLARFKDFIVMNVESLCDLQQLFISSSLLNIYQDYVQGLVKVSNCK